MISNSSSSDRVQLSQWKQGVVDDGWQQVDVLLNSSGAVERAKPITLEIEGGALDLGSYTAILVVQLRPAERAQTEVTVRLHPEPDQIFLLPGVSVQLLDDTEAVLVQAQAQTSDHFLQLKVSGDVGEQFAIRVCFGTASLTEGFQL